MKLESDLVEDMMVVFESIDSITCTLTSKNKQEFATVKRPLDDSYNHQPMVLDHRKCSD